jgi:hypothetical protein
MTIELCEKFCDSSLFFKKKSWWILLFDTQKNPDVEQKNVSHKEVSWANFALALA